MGPSNEVGPPATQPEGTDTTTNTSAQPNASDRQHLDVAPEQLTGHDSARHLHELGMHVFPVDHPNQPECIGKHGPDSPCDGDRGKHPAVKWGTWAHTVTPQMIDGAWGKYRGLANIGVACGPSNLVVLDEDQHGELERWCTAYGITLPDTYTVSTGRGRHLYFYWDHRIQRISNSPKAVDGFKIDVRGDGGFAVAEGSRHANGQLYVGNGQPIAGLPAEVAELLLAGGQPELGAADTGQQQESVAGVVEPVDYNTAKIGFRKRHISLVAYSGRLRGKGLDYREAEVLLRERWLLCEQPEGQIPEAKFHSPDVPDPITWEQAKARLRDVFTRYPAGSNLNGAEYADPGDSGESPVGQLDVSHLEGDFWGRRPSLTTVYDGALARMCSPWAVLAHCAARVLALAKPRLVLPPLVGGKGSLNWFAAIAASSGGGKGSAARVARELVDEHVLTRNLGSGEGLIDAYIKTPGTAKTEPELYDSVMFVADEIDTLAALSARTGATLPSMLRSAFTGDTLGFSNRKASSLHLKENTYRLTLVVNVQPGRAGALMGDIHGGMLQRFMWFPGVDARISAEVADFPADKLTLPRWVGFWANGCELAVPVEAARRIREERVKSQRGEQSHLDTHALFVREKFAYALAALDGRDEMSGEDWELAGIAAAVSDHTRTWVAAQLEKTRHDEAAELGELRGVAAEAADNQKLIEQTRRVQRVRRWLLGKLDEAPGNRMTNRELTQKITSRDRPALPAALKSAADLGLIRLADDQVTWVKL